MADRQANRIFKSIVSVTSKEARGMALDIHKGLVEQTPVDTGWARANWIPSVSRPVNKPAGSPENVDVATSAAESGAVEVAGWTLDKGPIFISNNVPYISPLNNGSSSQAPAGFVEKTVQEEVEKRKRKKLL
jgi:hypothetical protein